jgi:putative transposase
MARHTEQEKENIVTLYQNGIAASELCFTYGISRSSLYEWVKQYSVSTPAPKSPREIYLLEKEVIRLRVANEILIKSGCSVAAPLKEKLAAIKRLKDEYSIHALCKVLDVNRATFYNYLFRSPEKTIIELEDDQFKPLILEIFKKSGERFGTRKIRAKLIENNYVISEKRISRLMKEMGLSSQIPARYPNATNDKKYKYYPNKLKRQFIQKSPNMAWVSDIKDVHAGNTLFHLCAITDLFSRKILSYLISNNMDTKLVISVFKEAFIKRGQPQGLMFHSDQGAQYTSYQFRCLLRKHKVMPSYSKPGVPFDNAVAESFFASITKEEFKRNYYNSKEELETAVQKYVEYFNDYRPHQSLGFKTPNQAESEYFEKQKKEKMLPGN